MFIIVGAVLMLIGGLWLIIEAFKESILWGLGCIFIPIAGLIFVLMHWDKAGKPFLIQVAGVALFALGGGFSDHRTSSLDRPRAASAQA